MGSWYAEADTPGLLSGDQDRSFWISWRNGVIEVGRGYVVGRERFMMWADPEPRSVHSVTFATGWGHNGHWEVDSFEGTHYHDYRIKYIILSVGHGCRLIANHRTID